MKTTLQKRQPKLESIISVLIQPCNENQELNYIETFKGTPDAIIRHSLDIIKSLQKALRFGTFSVKIESENLADCIYVDAENIYDENFEIISRIEKAGKYLLGYQ